MNEPRRITLLLGGLFLLYNLTSPGSLEVGDAEVRFAVAKSWVRGGPGDIPAGDLSVPGPDRIPNVPPPQFSFYGPLQSALMLPGILGARIASADPTKQDLIAKFVFSTLVEPAVAVLALLFAWRALRRLEIESGASCWAIATIGLGTIFFHYARSAQEESLVALGYAIWLFGYASWRSGRSSGIVWAATGACVAISTRWSSFPTLLVLFMFSVADLIGLSLRARIFGGEVASKKIWACAVLIVLATFGLLACYNQIRFGSPFETGYSAYFRRHGLPMFSMAGWPTKFAALIFGPTRGLLLYSPPILVAILVAVRQRRADAIVCVGLISLLATTAFVASYTYWEGGFSWGPRLLVAPTILLAPLFARVRWSKLILIPCVALQIASVTLPDNTEEFIRGDQRCVGTWNCSTLVLRPGLAVDALANTLSAQPGSYVVHPTIVKEILASTDYTTAYWWVWRLVFRAKVLSYRTALTFTLGAFCLILFLIGNALREHVVVSTTAVRKIPAS